MPRWLLWVALLLAGFLLRLTFVYHQPFTNDEGSYLYDAKTLLEGRLPGGDVLTKAPVPAVLFLASVWVTDGSLFAARYVAALLNTLTALPLAALGVRLFGPRVGAVVPFLWLFAAGPVLFAAFGQTEAVAGFFGAATLAAWARALNVGGPVGEPAGPWRVRGTLAATAGILLVLAFGSRKTSIVLGAPALLLLFVAPIVRSERSRVFRAATLAGLLIALPWIILSDRLYGDIGVREALGVGYADITAQHLSDPDLVRSWVGSPRWALGIAGRVAGPLLPLALLGLVSWGRVRIPLAWFAGGAVLYAAWPTLLPDYLPDALGSLVLLAAAGSERVWSTLSRRGVAVVSVLWLAWNVGVLFDVWRRPWIGMFTAEAVERAAVVLRDHVPPEESVFTAAVIVPYRSDHRVLFDIAHPFWYRYGFIKPEVHRTFLPPLADIEDAVRTRVRFALVDRFTTSAYLKHPSDLRTVIWRDYTFVRKIPNETGYQSNPLLLWRR